MNRAFCHAVGLVCLAALVGGAAAAYPGYQAARARAAQHDHASRVLVADAVFSVVDLAAKDLFVFTGKVPVPTPVLPPPPPPLPPRTGDPPRVREVVALDQEGDVALPLAGYEDAAGVAAPTDPRSAAQTLALAGLRNSCASCHSEPRGRGGVSFFDAAGSPKGIDWKSVRDAAAGTNPTMPPATAGRPAFTPEQAQAVRLLASDR